MARILIVDDSMISRAGLREILLNAGHEIAGEAANGEEAYAIYNESNPDIVTMDITMPVMNGMESLRKIRQSHPDAKVIMITALSQTSKVLESLSLGAMQYITKPFDARKIVNIIDDVLKN